MQIQRWQSLFLLIAAALTGVLTIMPLGIAANGAQVVASQSTILLIVNVLVALLLFFNIFMYKNLSKQMLVANVSVVLLLLSGFLAGKTVIDSAAQFAWLTAVPAYVVTLVLAIGARCLMRRDYNLLRSADRLR